MQKKLTNILLILALQIFGKLDAAEDTPQRIVLVYGASCSGKSTLSHSIANHMGGSWHVIDRDEVIELYQQMNVEDPQEVESHADEYLIAEMHRELGLGKHLVVDTQFPRPLIATFQKYSPISVFVYAPLAVLLARDDKRTQVLQREAKRQYYARAFVLETYVQLLTFENSVGYNYVDFISYSDFREDILYYAYKPLTFDFFQALQMLNHSVPIYALDPYDLLIRSDIETVAQAVLRVHHVIQQR